MAPTRDPDPSASSPAVSEHLRRAVASLVRGLERVDPLLVVRTDRGQAQGLAEWIDRAQLAEVAGTVAGDDTILLDLPRRRRRACARSEAERHGQGLRGAQSLHGQDRSCVFGRTRNIGRHLLAGREVPRGSRDGDDGRRAGQRARRRARARARDWRRARARARRARGVRAPIRAAGASGRRDRPGRRSARHRAHAGRSSRESSSRSPTSRARRPSRTAITASDPTPGAIDRSVARDRSGDQSHPARPGLGTESGPADSVRERAGHSDAGGRRALVPHRRQSLGPVDPMRPARGRVAGRARGSVRDDEVAGRRAGSACVRGDRVRARRAGEAQRRRDVARRAHPVARDDRRRARHRSRRSRRERERRRRRSRARSTTRRRPRCCPWHTRICSRS